MQASPLIWYGVQGEGRGHASRSKVLIEALRRDGCRVRVFTGGDALAVLGADPELEQLPQLRFAFRDGGLHLPSTLWNNAPLAWDLLNSASALRTGLLDRMNADRPDLVVTDFEPVLPRVAKSAGIPFVCVDHQHFLVDTCLPKLDQPFAAVTAGSLATAVKCIAHGPRRIVSSFHHFRRSPDSPAHLVGCFLRDAIRQAVPVDRGHVCLYLKEARLLNAVLPVLRAAAPMRFEIWTSAAAPQELDNISIRLPDPIRFVESLAGCRWFMGTAGNQALGEALALGKPVLAAPLPGQSEQDWNALALEESGCGRAFSWKDFSLETLGRFAFELPQYRFRVAERNRLLPEMVDGTAAALGFVRQLLERPLLAAA